MPLFNPIPDASTSIKGLVNTTAQTFGGQKGFNAGTIVSQNSTAYLGSGANGIAAAGTTLAGATQLVNQANRVSSSTLGVNDGVKLYDEINGVTGVGYSIFVKNLAGVAINVYPPNAGSEINGLGNGNPLAILTGTGATFVKVTSTLWLAIQGT